MQTLVQRRGLLYKQVFIKYQVARIKYQDDYHIDI
jgi:hypothetical protein